MKIGRKPIQILFLFIIVPSISSTSIILFLSFFELSFAQRDVNENDVNTIKKNYHNDWKSIKDKIISITNSENTKPFNKIVNNKVFLDFNHFGFLHIIQDVKDNRYEPSFPRNTIIPITLYPNMSSLEDARVYQNMSSLGQDRVYQNMSSLAP